MDNTGQSSFQEVQAPLQKIYSRRAIYGGTFLGGPIACGYLFASNFNAFDEPAKAKKAWAITAVATMVIFGIAFLLPPKFPPYILPVIYCTLASVLVQKYQGGQILQHLNNGGTTYGFWRTFGIGIAGLAITLLLLFLIGFSLALAGVNVD